MKKEECTDKNMPKWMSKCMPESDFFGAKSSSKPLSSKSSFSRIQSPSSINTYKQCPRKYYYQYIEKLETLPSIHLTRGKLAHSILEDFFKIDVSNVSNENFMFELRIVMAELFKKHWNGNLKAMRRFSLTAKELDFYQEETRFMVNNWLNGFLSKLVKQTKEKRLSVFEAFKRLTPRTEIEYVSEEYGIRGFIDAIHELEDDIILMDYKTSKRPDINEEYRLQLAIYALLYAENHRTAPTKVGINFLKFNEQHVDVDEGLLEFAKREVRLVHEATLSNNIKDYQKRISSLCKWHSGQCDFYEVCNNSD